MTEVLATGGRPKRRNDATCDPVLVSSYALATHLGMTRQNIVRLTAEGVIARSGDGYDLDASRLHYLTHVRSEHRRSPRAAADAEHASAKAALLRLRIAEKQRELLPTSEHNAFVDELAGLLLTKLSGLPARVAGTDLGVRRKAEAAVFELRKEIAEACQQRASEYEPDEA